MKLCGCGKHKIDETGDVYEQHRLWMRTGAGKWHKGDVVRDGLARLEAKSTRAKSYTLTLDTLRKVVGEAKDGEIPAVVVHFFDGHTAVESVAVCPYPVFMRLVHGSTGSDD
jgi:hypothetical protein